MVSHGMSRDGEGEGPINTTNKRKMEIQQPYTVEMGKTLKIYISNPKPINVLNISKISNSNDTKSTNIVTNKTKTSISQIRLKNISSNNTQIEIVKKTPAHSISIVFMGRLGNLMFQYASLYGIAKKNSLRQMIPPNLYIDKLFHLDAYRVSSGYGSHFDTKYEEKKGCTFEKQVMELGPDKDVFLWGYFQSWKYFQGVEDEIKKQFTFKETVTAKSKEQIGKLTKTTDRSRFILVGVHVRRGDMVDSKNFVDYGYIAADELYLNQAMDYFNENYSAVKFLIVSDDMVWCRKALGKRQDSSNVLFAPTDNPPEVDMALLTSCNHTVMTVGSFGWWAAWLTGGDVVYYKGYPKPGSKLFKLLNPADYRYPHWIGL